MWAINRPRPQPAPRAVAPDERFYWVPRVAGYAVVIGLSVLGTYITDYNWPTRTGNLCVILFVAANIYIPARYLRKRFQLKGVQVYFTWGVRWHCVLNTAAFTAACFHCATTAWTNNWLWLSLFLMGWLTVGGFLMRFRYPPRVRKGLYILHTQRAAFFLLLYALLKGHYVFSWLP